MQTNYICPLCSKSLGDMELYFASIDELLEREQMPPEYQDYKSLIYCSDCERKSTTSFHFMYHKVTTSTSPPLCPQQQQTAHTALSPTCPQCQFDDCMSYNTKLLRQFKESDSRIASAESELLVNITQ